MSSFFTFCWQYGRAFALIYLCLLAGNGISAVLPLHIPGSIMGMLTLFLLLTCQLVPVAWIKPGCQLFIRHMALLFVPVSVGVMKYYDVLIDQFGPLVISCLVSSVITMLLVGYSSHFLHGDRKKPIEKNKEIQ